MVDSIVRYQLPNGGWLKNQDWHKGVDVHEYDEAVRTGIGATIDNKATWGEIRTLANEYARHPEWSSQRQQQVRHAVVMGLQYILSMPYENGGFPQFYPPKSPQHYSRHITFNDGAMTQVLRLLRDVGNRRPPFDALQLGSSLCDMAREAYKKGIDCILRCQVVKGGKRTVWCQQHDAETLQPVGARAYELPSLSGAGETVDILRLLMEEEQPSAQMKEAVESGVAWLRTHALRGKRVETFQNAEGRQDKRLVDEPSAPLLWARFYDLEQELPFFSDRTGQLFRNFSDIQYERRMGYAWFGTQPQSLLAEYEQWQKKNTPSSCDGKFQDASLHR